MTEASLNDLSRAKVLLVEDNKHNRDLFMELLSVLGIKTIVMAENGEDALQILSRDKDFDLIILDVVMPRMDGEEFLTRIKQDKELDDIPVLSQTGNDSAEAKEKMFKAGASDYITKPVNPMEFFSRVKVHLENHMMIKRLRAELIRREKDMNFARQMQESLFPTPIEVEAVANIYDIEVEHDIEFSKSLSRHFWRLDKVDGNTLLFSVGAFSGEGMSAAINSLRFNSLFNTTSIENEISLVEVIKRINDKLIDFLLRGQSLSLLCLLVNTLSGKMHYVNAGYGSPVHVSANGTVKVLEHKGNPLGISKSSGYKANEISFAQKDMLFSYSDIIINGKNKSHKTLGIEGMKDMAANHSPLTDQIVAIRNSFPDPLEDDLAAFRLIRK